MIKRIKKNVKTVVLLTVLVILVVMALKTVWVGMNLCFMSNWVVESSQYADEYPAIRKEADIVYNEVSIEREKFYNSEDPYVRWLSNQSNVVRVPLGLVVILLPFAYVYAVRSYNENKRRKNKKTRG